MKTIKTVLFCRDVRPFVAWNDGRGNRVPCVGQEIVLSAEMSIAILVRLGGPVCHRVVHGSNIACGYKRESAFVIADSCATHGIYTLAGIPRNGIVGWSGFKRKMYTVHCTDRVWEALFGLEPVRDRGLSL